MLERMVIPHMLGKMVLPHILDKTDLDKTDLDKTEWLGSLESFHNNSLHNKVLRWQGTHEMTTVST